MELDLRQPLAPLELAADEEGLGCIVRLGSRPLGFLLQAAEPGRTFPVTELEALIAQELGSRLMEDAIAEELRPPAPALPPPSLTVAICTRNHPDLLSRCLASLQSLRAQHRFEILVVDNDPPDDQTRKAVSRERDVAYLVEPKVGLDFARNLAWRSSTTAWIAYLDDDVVVDAHWFAAFQAALARNPDAGALTGLVLPWRLDTTAEILFEKRGGFRRGFDARRFREHLPGNVCFPAGAGVLGTGCNMAFRRDVLASLGGFDEALDTGRPLPGGGDLDIFFRVIAAGVPFLYEPGFLVRHEHRKDEAALRHQYYTWGLGLMAYVGKHLRHPEHRALFKRLIRWWFREQLRQLKERFRGRHPLPASMIWAEFWGGCVGIAGEYERSLRRVAKIRKAHP